MFLTYMESVPSLHMGVPANRGFQNVPKHTTNLILGAPKKEPVIVGNPHPSIMLVSMYIYIYMYMCIISFESIHKCMLPPPLT